jgi:hypothetical protein
MNSDDFPPEFRGGARTIAVDFDGVLHDDYLGFHDGSCYGDPIKGSLDSIQRLSLRFRVVVFSAKARADRPLYNGLSGAELIWDWLRKHGLESYVSEVTSEKPRAELYIDDNGFRFENWAETVSFIEREMH